MRVLIACEFSGIVRDAFAELGHDAWSCDFLSTERPGNHIQDDVLNHLEDGWDLMIAHPPCTYLCSSGARWWKDKLHLQKEALQFFGKLLRAPIPKRCIENPVGVVSTYICKPTQTVEPYWFGHPETKRTCLWLRGLPPLTPTNIVKPPKQRHTHKKNFSRIALETPSEDRWKNRSRTYEGLAKAMAMQWG